MTRPQNPADLIVLVADKNMQAVLEALLARTESFQVRPFDYQVHLHPRSDPGCRLESENFLRPFTQQFSHALVLFDYQGCGAEHSHSSEQIENDVESRLELAGWNGHARAIVIDPELEIWVWSRSSRVEEILGWQGKTPDLRSWLVEDGRFRILQDWKPEHPKEALEAALKHVRKVRSSAVLRQLAQQISWRGCTNRAFLRLQSTLQTWFPKN